MNKNDTFLIDFIFILLYNIYKMSIFLSEILYLHLFNTYDIE